MSTSTAFLFASVSALLLNFGATPLPCSRLAVDLVFDGEHLPPRLQASAMEEAAGIWAWDGADVHVRDREDAADEGAVQLSVTIAPEVDPSIAADALGSIPFAGDEPRPRIFL